MRAVWTFPAGSYNVYFGYYWTIVSPVKKSWMWMWATSSKYVRLMNRRAWVTKSPKDLQPTFPFVSGHSEKIRIDRLYGLQSLQGQQRQKKLVFVPSTPSRFWMSTEKSLFWSQVNLIRGRKFESCLYNKKKRASRHTWASTVKCVCWVSADGPYVNT